MKNLSVITEKRNSYSVSSLFRKFLLCHSDAEQQKALKFFDDPVMTKDARIITLAKKYEGMLK